MNHFSKRVAHIDQHLCVACGVCINSCPKKALSVPKGVCCIVDPTKCIGCGLCTNSCPASVIELIERKENPLHE